MTTAAPISTIPATPQLSNLTGIAYGMGAGMLWGLVFLAPELVPGFGPLQLSIGRYLCYGLIAAVMLAPRWRLLKARISRRQWLNLLWLALTGNALYYTLLSSAVQHGGIAMTSLVIGFLPVAITLIGSRDHGAVSLTRLLPSLLSCIAGAACIGWQALAKSTSTATHENLIGLLCAIGALASWTAFAIGNARCLTRLQHVSSHDWNLLIGIVTGAQSIVLIPLALAFETTHHSASAWMQFGAVSISVAVIASMFGNVLWNQMSRRLPLTLVGQMILFETLFALIYGLLWEQRLPTALEISALGFVVMSVLWCFAAHRKPASPNNA